MAWLWWLLAVPGVLVLFVIVQVVHLVFVMKKVVDFFQFNPMTWLSFETISMETGISRRTLSDLLAVMANEAMVETRIDSDAIAKRGKSAEAMKQIKISRTTARLFEYRFVRRGRRRPRLSELIKSKFADFAPDRGLRPA